MERTPLQIAGGLVTRFDGDYAKASAYARSEGQHGRVEFWEKVDASLYQIRTARRVALSEAAARFRARSA